MWRNFRNSTFQDQHHNTPSTSCLEYEFPKRPRNRLNVYLQWQTHTYRLCGSANPATFYYSLRNPIILLRIQLQALVPVFTSVPVHQQYDHVLIFQSLCCCHCSYHFPSGNITNHIRDSFLSPTLSHKRQNIHRKLKENNKKSPPSC